MANGLTERERAEQYQRACTFAIAGLLHDAGKIYQPFNPPLDGTIERMEQQLCPTDRRTGQAGYRHVLYTAQLIDRAKGDWGGLDKSQVFRLAGNHHRPSAGSLDEWLIALADRLASGHDRREQEEADIDAAQATTGLESIFCRVNWPQADVMVVQNNQVPTKALSYREDDFLPQARQDWPAYQQACRALAEELEAGLNVSYSQPGQCVEGLQALTGRVFHAVVSSRRRGEQSDVSLYDHSHIVAAFAACLAVQYSDATTLPDQVQGHYRLLTVALGQIQDFIFRQQPVLDAVQRGEKGMAKRLRGRSAYVALLSRLAARRLLHSLGLPMTNLVYDAGGRAMLLLPDTAPVLDELAEAIDRVQQWFSRHLPGALRLDIACSDRLTDADFLHDRFLHTVRHMQERLGWSRLQLADSTLRDGSTWHDDHWVLDHSQGMPADGAAFSTMLQKFGRKLTGARYLTLAEQQDSNSPCDLAILDYAVTLHEHRPDQFCYALQPLADQPARPVMDIASYIPRATEQDIQQLNHLLQEQADDDTIDLSGDQDDHEQARRPGQPLTFTELAVLGQLDASSQARHAMLAALKADVDRLGMILAYGLGGQVSLGRLAALSRGLNHFFKGFLQERLREQYPRVYTVFSGGDDLFLIGHWLDLVRLTADLKQWFDRMVCRNANLTFSAGLVFAKPTTPVRHLAYQADDALDKAKHAGRNRLVIGSILLDWPQLDRALETWRMMVQLARLPDDKARLKSSLVYRLYQYAGMAEKCTRPNTALADFKWRAQLNYDLVRNYPVNDRFPQIRKLYECLLALHEPQQVRILKLACLLTLYQLRGEPL